MSRHFAMLVSSPQARPAVPAEAGDEEYRLRADRASRVLSGPGLWTDWLEELDRRGLIEQLLADGVIDEAVATAPHGHQLDRALNAKKPCCASWPGACSPARAMIRSCAPRSRMPGPGPQARHPGPDRPGAVEGPGAVRRARGAAGVRARRGPRRRGLGTGATVARDGDHAFDGTTAELFSNDVLADAFGVPEGGTKPKVRIVAARPHRARFPRSDGYLPARQGRRAARKGPQMPHRRSKARATELIIAAVTLAGFLRPGPAAP